MTRYLYRAEYRLRRPVGGQDTRRMTFTARDDEAAQAFARTWELSDKLQVTTRLREVVPGLQLEG